jgi:glycosyltransferase involved in cell wall biosynthesis
LRYANIVAAEPPYSFDMASVVIPAHNEERVLGRLLSQLAPANHAAEFEIIVVANGCTDCTAEVAASFGPPVRVISIPVASKSEALTVGNSAAKSFPRLYVDADVEFHAEDARALMDALERPGVLAASPERRHAMEGQPWHVRWYYDIWERLPEVRRGLFGRGVIAISQAGYRRIVDLPQLMADDLVVSLMFSPEERVIAQDARVTVHPPRTLADLLRRRTRVAMGLHQIKQTANAPRCSARTRIADVIVIVCLNPRLALRAVVFIAITVMARRKSRSVTGQWTSYDTWLRDDSSRDSPGADLA